MGRACACDMDFRERLPAASASITVGFSCPHSSERKAALDDGNLHRNGNRPPIET